MTNPPRHPFIDCTVTSPPYFGLRDYGHPGQIGAEKSPAEFVELAQRLGRKYVGIELNKDYLDLSLRTRLADGVLDFEEEQA